MLGLERGTVKLLPHDPAWEAEGKRTVEVLRGIFGEAAVDIRHVGSTAVRTIVAKPIIDIAVGVRRMDEARALIPHLEKAGFFHRHAASHGEDHLFFSCVGEAENVRTHHIHVVPYGEDRWISYVSLVEYLNMDDDAAKEYEYEKKSCAGFFPNDRALYTENKLPTLKRLLRKAKVYYYLGKTVHIEIDRPVGYLHEKKPEPILYPINYGFIPKVLGGDDEELDVYLLGVNEPVSEFDCRIIGIIHRTDDVEDKLVGVPEGVKLNQAEIAEAVDFQEKYHKSYVEPYYHKSCGGVIYRMNKGEAEYLVLCGMCGVEWSLPKGHMERGETEREAANREIFEECGVMAPLAEDFREEMHYPEYPIGEKEVALFLAEYYGDVKVREGEISNYRWVRADEAKKLLYCADHVIDRAEEYIKRKRDAEHLR